MHYNSCTNRCMPKHPSDALGHLHLKLLGRCVFVLYYVFHLSFFPLFTRSPNYPLVMHRIFFGIVVNALSVIEATYLNNGTRLFSLYRSFSLSLRLFIRRSFSFSLSFSYWARRPSNGLRLIGQRMNDNFQ